MKILKKITVLIGLACAFFLTGCSNANEGLPDEITFPKEGGKITLKTRNQIDQFDHFYIGGEIMDYDYEHAGEPNDTIMDSPDGDAEPSDSIIITEEWLTLKARVGEKKFVLIADSKKTKNDVLEFTIDQRPWKPYVTWAEIRVKRAQ